MGSDTYGIAMLLHIVVVVTITLTRLHRHLFGRWHLIIECDIIILRFGSGKASSTHHWAHSAQGICWQSVQLNVIKKWSPCIIWFSYCHLKLSVFWNRTNTQTYDNTYLDAVTWFGIMKYTRLNSQTHTHFVMGICYGTTKQSEDILFTTNILVVKVNG